jgi:RNA polymerase sigma-70 factor (ECF subfamily)
MLPLILAILTKGDGDLLVRLQRRDPQALAELYDRYGRMVFGLILRTVQDRGTAEDLVQETFLRVWNRVGGFDAEHGAVGPWLLAVARNRAIDYLRYRGRRPEAALELNESENPALFADLKSDPLRFDTVRQVKTALEKLPAPQREAIELAYFEGMSQTEIAERLRQPLGTVKSWMRRALLQMREELGGGVPA